jgi:hypothetical protein
VLAAAIAAIVFMAVVVVVPRALLTETKSRQVGSDESQARWWGCLDMITCACYAMYFAEKYDTLFLGLIRR